MLNLLWIIHTLSAASLGINIYPYCWENIWNFLIDNNLSIFVHWHDLFIYVHKKGKYNTWSLLSLFYNFLTWLNYMLLYFELVNERFVCRKRKWSLLSKQNWMVWWGLYILVDPLCEVNLRDTWAWHNRVPVKIIMTDNCLTIYFCYTHDPETVLNASGCIEAILLPLSHSKRAMLAFRSSANWSNYKSIRLSSVINIISICIAKYFSTWSKTGNFVAIFIEETIAYTSSIELFCQNAEERGTG